MDFRPSLSSTSFIASNAHVRFCLLLSTPSILPSGSTVQVWTNLGSLDHNWFSADFVQVLPPDPKGSFDLVGKPVHQPPVASFEALLPCSHLPGSSYHFTFRLLHHDGSITWVGDTASNGTLLVEKLPDIYAGFLHTFGLKQSREWTAAPDTVLAHIDNASDCYGWAISRDKLHSFSSLQDLTTRACSIIALFKRTSPEAVVVSDPILLQSFPPNSLVLNCRDVAVCVPAKVTLHSLTPDFDLHSVIKSELINSLVCPWIKPASAFFGLSITEAGGKSQDVHVLPRLTLPSLPSLLSLRIPCHESAESADVVALFSAASGSACFAHVTGGGELDLNVVVSPFGGHLKAAPAYRVQGTIISVVCPPAAFRTASLSVQSPPSPPAVRTPRRTALSLRTLLAFVSFMLIAVLRMLPFAFLFRAVRQRLLGWSTATEGNALHLQSSNRHDGITNAKHYPELTFDIITGESPRVVVLVQCANRSTTSQPSLFVDGKLISANAIARTSSEDCDVWEFDARDGRQLRVAFL